MTAPTIALTRPQRRALLVAHVVTSVGWLGVSGVMLTLAIAARVSDSQVTVAAAYWAMHLFGAVLVLPMSLLSLVTGVLLGLGTKWGLLRHVWVVTKLVLTVVAVLLILFALLGQIDAAYAHSRPGASSAGLSQAGRSLLFAGGVSTALYSFITAVSVLKPWGQTGRFKRHRALAR